MFPVVVGFGANLGDPPAAFAAGLAVLAEKSEIRSVSRVWRTLALGPEQPDYLNAAALVGWKGSPWDLLELCREIESSAGRDRGAEERWGPRVLDLDLLICRDLVCRGSALELPHPRLHERAFALVPTAELVPDWVHPLLGRTVADLADDARRADPDALIGTTDWRPFGE
jgi:2-amino-4-hydroxy-6-hydroxymethyldihydropteridine diphosphokinase